MNLQEYRKEVNNLLADYRAICNQLDEEQKTFIKATNNHEFSQEAQQLLQEVAQVVQQEAHNRIASVVSLCLESVFDDPYKFKIEFERKRGKTEARLVLTRNSLVLNDPINEAGGGVIDVASFALRLACLILSRPQKRRILVLDEPFTNIRGKENRCRMRQLLMSLAQDLNVQFILNIDIDSYPEFALGKVVEIEK